MKKARKRKDKTLTQVFKETPLPNMSTWSDSDVIGHGQRSPAAAVKRTAVCQCDIDEGLRRLAQKVKDMMVKKGSGAWLTSHEIHGFVMEEVHELCNAISTCPSGNTHGARRNHYANELMDTAVAAIFGYVCIKGQYTEW